MHMFMKDAKHTVKVAPRINIIFHGLLAFRDLDAAHYEVLIPPGGPICHDAVYGNPLTGDRHEFADPSGWSSGGEGRYPGPGPARYAIEGVSPESPGRISRPAAANALIVRNQLLDIEYSRVRATIKVPKPRVIRHYRGTEVLDISLGQNPDTAGAIVSPPQVVHEVTVFSYFAFYQPRLVGPDTDFCFPQPFSDAPFFNLCIYCQPSKGQCDADDSDPFNKMFLIRSPSVPGKNEFKIDLTLGGSADDWPPLGTGANVGISFWEMLSLSELSTAEAQESLKSRNVAIMLERAGMTILNGMPGGCGSLFASDDSSL